MGALKYFTFQWEFESESEGYETATLEVEVFVDKGVDYGVERSPKWTEYTVESIYCDNRYYQEKAASLYQEDEEFRRWLDDKIANYE